MSAEVEEYIRCYNCGKWIDETNAVAEFYCSGECTEQYERCFTCGRFFSKAKGIKSGICSESCGREYVKTDSKYVVTEELL